MKSKKAAKYIVKHPDLFSEGEQMYAQMWLRERKFKKLAKKIHEESSKIDLSLPEG